MAFGKGAGDLHRDGRGASVLSDPERLELLDLGMVRGLASAARIDPGQASPANLLSKLLERCVLLREIVHRTGQIDLLVLADRSAERVARGSERDGATLAAARLQQALCALELVQLCGDAEAMAIATSRLAAAEQALGCTPGRLNGPGSVRGRLLAANALKGAGRAAMLDAVRAFDDAIGSLEVRLRANGYGKAEHALIRCERAELLIGMGTRLAEPALLDQALHDLTKLSAELDPDYLPLSFARSETLRGSALRALGDGRGEARLMKEAATAFRAALEAVPVGHSPLDRARAAHGLGLALQGIAETSGDTRLYRSALLAYDRALDDLPPQISKLRSNIAHDRAACLTRQAERGGDAAGLAEAETVLKAELVRRFAPADPVAWAVTQVSLARVYEARADLLGDSGERADAAVALTAALDVFAERGMAALSEVANTALKRLKEGHKRV